MQVSDGAHDLAEYLLNLLFSRTLIVHQYEMRQCHVLRVGHKVVESPVVKEVNELQNVWVIQVVKQRNVLNHLLSLWWRHLLLEEHLDRNEKAQMLMYCVFDIRNITVSTALFAKEILVLHSAVGLKIDLQLWVDPVVALIFDPVDEITLF